jgi:hypothetical protein
VSVCHKQHLEPYESWRSPTEISKSMFYLQIENELPTPWYNEQTNTVLTITVSLRINGEIPQNVGLGVPLTATLHYEGNNDVLQALQGHLEHRTDNPEIGEFGVVGSTIQNHNPIERSQWPKFCDPNCE